MRSEKENLWGKIAKFVLDHNSHETTEKLKMTKLDIEIGDGEIDYHGSKVFAPLADAIGLSVDLVSYFATQILFPSHTHSK